MNTFLSPKRSDYPTEEGNLSALRKPDGPTSYRGSSSIQQGGRSPPPSSCSFEHKPHSVMGILMLIGDLREARPSV